MRVMTGPLWAVIAGVLVLAAVVIIIAAGVVLDEVDRKEREK